MEYNELEYDSGTLKHDQYCHYENLPRLLKRFSFKEKMRMAALHSSEIIVVGGDVRNLNSKNALPWFLETFVMLAMEAVEYTDGSLDGKKFAKMYNSIMKESSNIFDEKCGWFHSVDVFMPVIAQTQFYLQEQPWIRRYRYWNVFNDESDPVNMKKVFLQKMGTEYEEYLLLGHLLQMMIYAQKSFGILDSQKVLHYLLNVRFRTVANHLRITRDDYIMLQRRFVSGSVNTKKYVYSLSPSYQYTFVDYQDEIYIPLPHLINQNTTSSLLYRLTEGDNELRRKIGKHIWEKYVFKLVSEAGVYHEVYPEKGYIFSGSASSSPDILARIDEEVLFIDSKSTVPSIGIRLLDPDAYDDNIRYVAENIKKLYNQICRFDRYNPFSGKVSFDKANHWGIVLVLEDAYIRRICYFEKAKEMLHLDDDSDEWNWMKDHIKVVSLYELERVCLEKHSLIEACRVSFASDPFNYTFVDYPSTNNKITHEGILKFKTMLEEKVREEAELMHKEGVI